MSCAPNVTHMERAGCVLNVLTKENIHVVAGANPQKVKPLIQAGTSIKPASRQCLQAHLVAGSPIPL